MECLDCEIGHATTYVNGKHATSTVCTRSKKKNSILETLEVGGDPFNEIQVCFNGFPSHS